MIETQVAIIGGGLAGLQAARLLTAVGVDFVLIEARDRLGGRIHTVDDNGQSSEDGFDLGPSWFWPEMQPAMRDLVRELGLEAFAQNSAGDVVFERMSRERPHRYSSQPQEPQSMRLGGGSAAIIRAIAAQIAPERILLATRVAVMTLEEEGVALQTVAKGRTGTVRARHVIAAMPPRLIDATIVFQPALEAGTITLWRQTPTWMAPHAKFFAIYDRPFWREQGLSGTAQSMVGPMAEIHDATTASGKAALFGFMAIAAEQREQLGEAALSQACIGQLVRVFGEEARRPSSTILKDWASDPFTATPTDRVAGGHPVPSTAPWVSGAWSARLSLGGSEVSQSEAGYLAGAVTAAMQAVKYTLTRFDLASARPSRRPRRR